MRRLLSILLLAFFGLPSVTPLLALSALDDASLPLCCRKGGQHHCMGGMEQPGQAYAGLPEWRALRSPCPHGPRALAATHLSPTILPTVQSGLLVPGSHPSSRAQTEARGRIARTRSHPKRGPPSSV